MLSESQFQVTNALKRCNLRKLPLAHPSPSLTIGKGKEQISQALPRRAEKKNIITGSIYSVEIGIPPEKETFQLKA